MKNLDLEKLQDEVTLFYKKTEKEIGEKVCYKIFFSKFPENAEILFIGINPGAGEQCQSTKPLEKLEYLQWDYSLAKETKSVFNLAGYPNLLEKLDKENKVLKTNFFYYVDSENGVKIDEFKDTLISKELREELFKKSYEWTLKFIELIKPKIIICEGKTAYHSVNVAINEEQIEKYEKNDNLIIKYKNFDFVLLSYSRNYSNIKNKSEFVEILKIELDKIYKN